MLAHNRAVNIIVPLNSSEESVKLLHEMRPDTVILSFSSVKDDFEGYEKRMHEKYDPWCGKLEILPRQAETSTSARISQIIIDGAKELLDVVEAVTTKLKEAAINFFTKSKEAA